VHVQYRDRGSTGTECVGVGGRGAYSVDDHSCCLHVFIQQATGEKETSTQWRAGFVHRG